MKRLGEILIAKGMVSPDGLRSGLDACRRHGGRLGTWLVRLGLVSEAKLLGALAEQSGCPAATTLQLATAPSDVRAVIPPAFGRRNFVVAFARHGRNIDVALIRPNDLLLVDEISKVTGLIPRPHVATEAALTAALALTGVPTPPPAPPPPPGPPQGTVREWRQFWQLESSPPELMRALEAPALKGPATTAATFPHLTPLTAVTGAVTPRETQDLADALSAATHRDQVAGLVLANLAGMAYRIALFSVYQNKVMGWAAQGPSIVEEDFHTLILPLNRPSLFLNLSRGVDIHVGPLGGGELNDLLLDALGSPPPREAVVVPVRVRGKTAGFLWLDQGEQSVADISIPNVQEAARLIGLALEILVLRQKVRTGARLTGGAPPD